MSDIPQWAIKAAQALQEEWVVGNWSRFCDEIDFDSAEDGDIAKLIWDVYQKEAP